MFILFFLLWIIFNGRITLEICVIGLILSTVLYLFFCKVMHYSARYEKRIFQLFFKLLGYLGTLLWEVVKANVAVAKIILSRKAEVSPRLIYYKTDLKSDTAKVALANSITLTPGTITVSLQENEYVVHALTEELGEGIEDIIFYQKLKRMEEE